MAEEMTEVPETIEPVPVLTSKQESIENTSDLEKSSNSKDPKTIDGTKQKGEEDIEIQEEDIKSTHSSANLSWAELEDNSKLTKHTFYCCSTNRERGSSHQH